MKAVGIIVNVLTAAVAVIMICSSFSIEFHDDRICWEVNDKINIVIALLLLIVSLLFAQVYGQGGKK